MSSKLEILADRMAYHTVQLSIYTGLKHYIAMIENDPMELGSSFYRLNLLNRLKAECDKAMNELQRLNREEPDVTEKPHYSMDVQCQPGGPFVPSRTPLIVTYSFPNYGVLSQSTPSDGDDDEA